MKHSIIKAGPETWNCSGCGGNSAHHTEMTRDCPQRLLTGIEKQLVSQGLLNYIDGNWWSRRSKKDNFVVGLVPLADLLPDNAGWFNLAEMRAKNEWMNQHKAETEKIEEYFSKSLQRGLNSDSAQKMEDGIYYQLNQGATIPQYSPTDSIDHNRIKLQEYKAAASNIDKALNGGLMEQIAYFPICLICYNQVPSVRQEDIKFCPGCLSDLRQIIMERKSTKK